MTINASLQPTPQDTELDGGLDPEVSLSSEDTEDKNDVPAVAPTPIAEVKKSEQAPKVDAPKSGKDFAEMRKKEQLKGQRQLARQLGFDSVEAMLEAHEKKNKNQSGEKKTMDPKSKPGTPTQSAGRTYTEQEYNKVLQQQRLAEEKAQKMAREKARQERMRKSTERELQAKQAEAEVRQIAIMAGVRDVDYAITLLKRHVAGKGIEFFKTFDEAAYFKGLKSTHGYLFSEVSAPATTGSTDVSTEDAPAQPGANAGAPKPPPSPGNVSKSAADLKQTDARSMSKEEYKKLLESRGLSTQ